MVIPAVEELADGRLALDTVISPLVFWLMVLMNEVDVPDAVGSETAVWIVLYLEWVWEDVTEGTESVDTEKNASLSTRPTNHLLKGG